MATAKFRQKNFHKIMCASSEELCSFLATLMNNEITTLTIPPLSTTIPQMDYTFKRMAQFCNQVLSAAGKAPLSLEELNKTFRGVPMLMDTIGTKCPSLKSLHILNLTIERNYIPLKRGYSLGDTFFKVVLPRLTILSMDCYECDDWTLIQIGSHGSSLE
jgi:hypothetical protein